MTVKAWRGALVLLVLLFVMFLFNKTLALKALGITGLIFKEMILLVPPIFILIGLIDVWIPKETLSKYLGKKSGFLGSGICFLMGSLAAGPLYGAFPLAALLGKKGVSLFNIIILLGAWSTTKIPMFLFEWGSLGGWFAFTRLLINIPLIYLIAWIMSRIITPNEQILIESNLSHLTS